jgi:hypothetical protein
MFNTFPSENGFYHKQPILSVINKIYLTTKQKQKQKQKQTNNNCPIDIWFIFNNKEVYSFSGPSNPKCINFLQNFGPFHKPLKENQMTIIIAGVMDKLVQTN